jgi:hypothetical protein
MVLFEKNAKEWQDENPDNKGNIIRDFATGIATGLPGRWKTIS